jgi:hypothetical protein
MGFLGAREREGFPEPGLTLHAGDDRRQELAGLDGLRVVAARAGDADPGADRPGHAGALPAAMGALPAALGALSARSGAGPVDSR